MSLESPRRKGTLMMRTVAPSKQNSSSSFFTPLPDFIVKVALGTETQEVLLFVSDLPVVDRSERRDDQGRSLMHLAAASATPDLMYELASNHVKLNTVDYLGRTPLHVAAKLGHIEQVTFLMSQGAQTWPLDAEGKSAADLARENHFNAVREYISHASGDGSGLTAREKRETVGSESEEGEIKETALEEVLSLEESLSVQQQRNWRLKAPILDPEVDLHLLWKEAEDIVSLQTTSRLIPLPWTGATLPALTEVWLALVPGGVQSVAGLLLMNGEYQLDCLSFAPGVDFPSPYTAGVKCTTFVGIDSSCVLQSFTITNRAVTLVRCIVTQRRDDVTEAAQRIPTVEEKRRLGGLKSRECAKTLLLRPIEDLRESSFTLRRLFRWSRSLDRFRAVMRELAERAYTVKRFLRQAVNTRKFSLLIARSNLQRFERYARDELKRMHTSQFPAISRAVKTTDSQRKLIVERALNERKQEFIRDMQRGKKSTRFFYMLELGQICNVYVDFIDVKEIALALMTKASFLPRATLVAMARDSHSVGSETIARQRVASVLRDMVPFFHKKSSFADNFLSLAVPENFLENPDEDTLDPKEEANKKKSEARKSTLYKTPVWERNHLGKASIRSMKTLVAPHVPAQGASRRVGSGTSPRPIQDLQALSAHLRNQSLVSNHSSPLSEHGSKSGVKLGDMLALSGIPMDETIAEQHRTRSRRPTQTPTRAANARMQRNPRGITMLVEEGSETESASPSQESWGEDPTKASTFGTFSGLSVSLGQVPSDQPTPTLRRASSAANQREYISQDKAAVVSLHTDPDAILVCTPLSPVPTLVGTHAQLRRMLCSTTVPAPELGTLAPTRPTK